MRIDALILLLIFSASSAFAKKEQDHKVAHTSVFLYYPTGPDITSFRATWTVPEPPTVKNGQSIAIWIGLEPEDSKIVLQPVLQWGKWVNGSNDEGWELACWIAKIDKASEVLFKSSRRSIVLPGYKVTGVIELVSKKDGVFTYKCYFEGYQHNQLFFQTQSRFNTALLEYEIQNVTSCKDYSDNVTFTDIELMAGVKNLTAEWEKAPREDPKKCGVKIKTSNKSDAVTMGVK